MLAQNVSKIISPTFQYFANLRSLLIKRFQRPAYVTSEIVVWIIIFFAVTILGFIQFRIFKNLKTVKYDEVIFAEKPHKLADLPVINE